ncbi:MAG: glycosyltransferase family 4 protein [Acidobacteriota bacterium]
MKDTLIFLSSNHKGDLLFRELAKRFNKSHYLFAGYGSLPLAYRMALRLLDKAGIHLKDRPRLDYRLRLSIAQRAWQGVELLVKESKGRPIHILSWHCLFPVTSDWRELGRVSAISDVPMTEGYFEHFRIRTPEARSLREKIRATTVENCEYLFTHSEWAAEENRSLYPAHAAKIFRIGWGSDMPPLSAEQALRPRGAKRLLSIGHDYFRKGVDFYDEVAGRLKALIPGLECLVAGNPGRHFRLKSLRHLTVLGPIARPQLAEYLKETSLFALFSRFEPAGHVTVEAMSYGVPVLCSSEGGLAEPVIDGVTGFVCRSFSVEQAVDRAYHIVNDPARLATFRERAYQHAQTCWQWSHVADRIMSRLECQELNR